MALWQGKSQRKPSGGRLIRSRKKRRFEIGREPMFTNLGEENLKKYRTMGGNSKVKMLSASFANVVDPKTNQVKRVKIVTVKSNTANPNYVQRNIMNRGATIQTELGVAKITSRPGQDGTINAVLISE
ncbi:30S ribosomal protein S8e [Methanomassiliicoccus luminyensis]|jgi:small subunit ribosomal protein S8e|uniref:30S ribosomal protein S8e n=1 Tax=Methanomassiliicoccus luminyensis TaxID=1080712 RepID=UPI000474A00F|nr:30S ribosomal protein S8e [Methanomassiliicoccus luminyensis]